MNTLTKRRLVLVLIIGLVAAAGVIAIDYYTARVSVPIEFENIQEVTISEPAGEHANSQVKQISVTASGSKIRLKKGEQYLVSYAGNEGYANGEEILIVKNSGSAVKISPSFSDKKLTSILDSQLGSIHEVLKKNYANMTLYEIQRGKLYQFGDWYGTTLKYIGPDPFNADTLRVVLKKDSNTWTVVTDPPNISLSKFDYPDIPEEVLRDINNRQ